jgi:hypothetical protein
VKSSRTSSVSARSLRRVSESCNPFDKRVHHAGCSTVRRADESLAGQPCVVPPDSRRGAGVRHASRRALSGRMAGGALLRPGPRQGLLMSQSGAWGGVKADLPAGAAADPQVALTTVACTSGGNCTRARGSWRPPRTRPAAGQDSALHPPSEMLPAEPTSVFCSAAELAGTCALIAAHQAAQQAGRVVEVGAIMLARVRRSAEPIDRAELAFDARLDAAPSAGPAICSGPRSPTSSRAVVGATGSRPFAPPPWRAATRRAPLTPPFARAARTSGSFLSPSSAAHQRLRSPWAP